MTRYRIFCIILLCGAVLATSLCTADSDGTALSSVGSAAQSVPPPAEQPLEQLLKQAQQQAPALRDDPFMIIEPDSDQAAALAQPVRIPGAEPIIPRRKAQCYVRSVMLKFLRAESLAPTIKSLLSEDGSVSVDVQTNSIIVSDSVEHIDRIVEQIKKADQTPRQILIEVVIVDVQLGNTTEIGVDWDNLKTGNPAESYKQKLIPSTSTTGGTLRIIHGNISATLHALQQVRDVEILASPRVIVVSGQKAMIQTIEEIPYTELSQSTGGVSAGDFVTSTKFKEAGVRLGVKPIITDENSILLTIEPAEQSVNTGIAGIGSSTVPIVDKRSVNTTLLMENGQTLMIGGLRRKDTRITVDKIPLLGDIPFIGFLFSSEKKEVENVELLVFISPHIYSYEPPTPQQQNRLNQLRNLPPLAVGEKQRPEFELIREWLTFPSEPLSSSTAR